MMSHYPIRALFVLMLACGDSESSVDVDASLREDSGFDVGSDVRDAASSDARELDGASLGPAGWQRLADTALAPHCPDEPSIHGATGCAAVTGAWAGGAYDSRRERLVVTGGGHNDYYGNELYALDVRAAAMARITEPGLPRAPFEPCEEAIVDGTQPNSRHTYDGIEYMAHVDRLWVFSGSLACGVGTFGHVTWTFDFGTMSWSRMEPTGDLPVGEAGMMAEWDPVSERLFVHDRNYLHSYDAEADVYRRVSGWAGLGYHHTGVIDPVRRLFVVMGYSSLNEDGKVYAWDISDVESGSAMDRLELSTDGAESVTDAGYPGLAFDPVSERIVAWAGGDTVYSFDPDADVWEAHTFPGGQRGLDNGTMGRFRYAPALDAFVVINGIEDDAHLFRLPR